MDSKSKTLADENFFCFYVAEKARVKEKREHNLISFASGIRRWRLICRGVLRICFAAGQDSGAKYKNIMFHAHHNKNLVDVLKQSK